MGNKTVSPRVPPDLRKAMVPIGAQATQELGKCADNWNDSEVALLRSKLPGKYHAQPIDYLRQWWINIRKKGTPGYTTGGHGPAKNGYQKLEGGHSREYDEWIISIEFKELAEKVKKIADYRCQLCNSEKKLDAHHRFYGTIKTDQEIRDMVALCRRCHRLFHEKIKDRTIPGDLF